MQLPLPENEVARLENLRSYGILDTPPEQAFDDLTRLAAYICGTPIALIGFMDLDRQWFKSRIGWDVPEVPRDMSFCAHTILQPDVLVVSDTLEDAQGLATCPLATHGGIRFYAGASLISAEGYALGTLCVMDSVPRGLTEGQTEGLRKLARQVMTQLESRRRSMSQTLSPVGSAEVPESKGVDGISRESQALYQAVPETGSDAKRAEEALRHSQQRLESIISSAMDAIITVDSGQRILVFNKAAEQVFGCAASEAIGQPIDKFIPQRFREKHTQHIQNFGRTGGTGRSMYSPGRLFALRSDGQEFPIEATISQAETEGEKLFTVILRDISARVHLEEELRQAQKIEAVGQLAEGVAHEFNNFLGVILGYSELLSGEAGENEGLRRKVAEIKAASQRAASLTRQLLAFSRKQFLEPQVLDLNQAIWETHKLLRRLVAANIDVVPVLAPNLGQVKADPGQIQQILINLVVNARDAMPGGGKVVIETANVELDEEGASQNVGLRPGSYVTLSVSDNGSGMDAETRSHIFEPFFTTKQPGKGTGLGLSTIYGIIKQSGGSITVEKWR
jgi:PAS domain S-box-containing protein